MTEQCKECGHQVNNNVFSFKLADGLYHENCTKKLVKEQRLPKRKALVCPHCKEDIEYECQEFKHEQKFYNHRMELRTKTVIVHGNCMRQIMNKEAGYNKQGTEKLLAKLDERNTTNA